MDTLGERLKYLRGTYSQSEFSAKLSIPQTTLSRYERNKSQPDLEFLRDFCDAFAVSAEWLVTGRGPVHRGETSPSPSVSRPQTAEDTCCPQCRRLEAELQEERRERRELNEENRRLWHKTEELWKENGILREKLARSESLSAPPYAEQSKSA